MAATKGTRPLTRLTGFPGVPVMAGKYSTTTTPNLSPYFSGHDGMAFSSPFSPPMAVALPSSTRQSTPASPADSSLTSSSGDAFRGELVSPSSSPLQLGATGTTHTPTATATNATTNATAKAATTSNSTTVHRARNLSELLNGPLALATPSPLVWPRLLSTNNNYIRPPQQQQQRAASTTTSASSSSNAKPSMTANNQARALHNGGINYTIAGPAFTAGREAVAAATANTNDAIIDPEDATFRDLTLREVLLSKQMQRIITINENRKVFEAILTMAENKIGALLVETDDKFISGIITERDYLNKIAVKGKDSRTTPISEVMTKDPIFATSTDGAMVCLNLMTERRFRHLPVIDADTNQLQGLVSIGDLVKITLNQLAFTVRNLKGYVDGTSIYSYEKARITPYSVPSRALTPDRL